MLAALVAGLISPLPLQTRATAAAFTAAAAVLVELLGLGHRLPQRRRLVPQSITLGDPRSAALQFGFEMGTGFRTLSPSSLPIATLGMLGLVGSWLPAAATALGFALGRAVTPSIQLAGDDGHEWDEQWWRSRRILNWTFAIALAVAAARLLAPLLS